MIKSWANQRSVLIVLGIQCVLSISCGRASPARPNSVPLSPTSPPGPVLTAGTPSPVSLIPILPVTNLVQSDLAPFGQLRFLSAESDLKCGLVFLGEGWALTAAHCMGLATKTEQSLKYVRAYWFQKVDAGQLQLSNAMAGVVSSVKIEGEDVALLKLSTFGIFPSAKTIFDKNMASLLGSKLVMKVLRLENKIIGLSGIVFDTRDQLPLYSLQTLSGDSGSPLFLESITPTANIWSAVGLHLGLIDSSGFGLPASRFDAKVQTLISKGLPP